MFRDPAPPLEAGIYRALAQRPQLPLAQSSNFWPMTAKLYEPLWRRRSLSLLTQGDFDVDRELELMQQWLALTSGARVLDVACSAGLYARQLLSSDVADLEVHALDMSEAFLQTGQRYSAHDLRTPIWVQADVRALPYQDSCFDAIVCGGSLNEFTDLAQSLQEMARVLKPGGRMWQMYLRRAHNWPGQLLQRYFSLSGIRFIHPGELNDQARAVGLSPQRAQYRGVVALALFSKS